MDLFLGFQQNRLTLELFCDVMKFGKCFLCNKYKLIAYNVTDILPDKQVVSHVMCENCGKETTKDVLQPKTKRPQKKETQESVPGVYEIKTPLDLLSFLMKPAQPEPEPQVKIADCTCGMSAAEFEKYGKFGCPNCYDHFFEYLEKMVFPYHKANQHIGKVPKRQSLEKIESSFDEKIKLLKLRKAQCIELEKYEDAAKLKSEIESLENSQIDAELPQVSSDQ